jgi:hypothetical protein
MSELQSETFESESHLLNVEMIKAHNKYYEFSPTGLIDLNKSPNGNIIYHLYSNGEITSQKGGTAYLQRSEFEDWNYPANSACKHLNLKLPKNTNIKLSYVILKRDECIYFRSKMMELLCKYKIA